MSRKFSVSVYKAFATSPNGFRLRTGGVAQTYTVIGRRGARKKNRAASGSSKAELRSSRRASRAAVHANPDPEEGRSFCCVSPVASLGDAKHVDSCQKHLPHFGTGVTAGEGDAKPDPSAGRMFSCCATPATDSQRHSSSEAKKTCCTSAAISNCKQSLSKEENFNCSGTACLDASSRPALLSRPPRASGGGLKGNSGGLKIFPCISPVTHSQRYPSDGRIFPSSYASRSAHPQRNSSDARIFHCCVAPATHSKRDYSEGWRLSRVETLDLRHQKHTRLPMDLSPIHGSMFDESNEQTTQSLTLKRSSPPSSSNTVGPRNSTTIRQVLAQAETGQAEAAGKTVPGSSVKPMKRRQLIFRLCRRRRTLSWRGGVISNKDKKSWKRPSPLVNVVPLNLLLRNRIL